MRRRIILLVLLLVAGLGLGGYGWRLSARRAIVIQYVPATPNLASLSAELGESVTLAEGRSHSWRHATEGLAELSRLYHANGFYPEALACYDGLRQVEPAQARWPHLQACIIADFGRTDEALPLRRQALALAPDYLPARLRLGDVLLKSNHPADAAPVYDEVLRREPGNPYALLGLARCNLARGDWAKARTRLQDAVEKNPGFIGALSLLVTVSEHFGDRGTAEALKVTIGRREFSDLPDPWLDSLAEVCYDSYRLSVAAAIADSAGNRTVALELLDRAIGLDAGASSYRRQAGQILINDGNNAAAKGHLEKAVEINPDDSDAWVLLITALRGLGQDQAAINTMLNGLAHCPRSPSLHLEHARWLKTNGRLDEAIAEFRYGYELRPSEASPLVELASAYFSANRTAEALTALNEALVRQPGHPMALATLTFYAISQHDEAGARKRWDEVHRLTKAPPEVLSGLRQAFLQQFGRELP